MSAIIGERVVDGAGRPLPSYATAAARANGVTPCPRAGAVVRFPTGRSAS
jgi:hypothetical protein